MRVNFHYSDSDTPCTKERALEALLTGMACEKKFNPELVHTNWHRAHDCKHPPKPDGSDEQTIARNWLMDCFGIAISHYIVTE